MVTLPFGVGSTVRDQWGAAGVVIHAARVFGKWFVWCDFGGAPELLHEEELEEYATD